MKVFQYTTDLENEIIQLKAEIAKLIYVVEFAKKLAVCCSPTFNRDAYPKTYDNCNDCRGCDLSESIAELEE